MKEMSEFLISRFLVVSSATYILHYVLHLDGCQLLHSVRTSPLLWRDRPGEPSTLCACASAATPLKSSSMELWFFASAGCS